MMTTKTGEWTISRKEYRDKVLGCWYGKTIGGTLGAPWENNRAMNDVEFYPPEINGESLPNDDLDLQLVWLAAVEREGVRKLNERRLAEYWDNYITGSWNEYGVCRNNIRMGILPPMSGRVGNGDWKWSNGAWIRSEIWACLFPASPHRAVRLAYCDACCDHEGEGIYAELFTAALESAAFAERDIQKLLDVALAFIPSGCRVARAVGLARTCYAEHLPFAEARNRIVEDSSDIGWFQAPGNLGFAVLGLLYGEGDFGRSVALAVNCGDDTDCTAGTVGAILGIINGRSGIPEKWCAPIGDGIRTCSIENVGRTCLLNVPATLTELTDRVVCCAELAAFEDPELVAFSDQTTLPDSPELLNGEIIRNTRDALGHKKSNELIYDLPYGTLHFEFEDGSCVVEEGKPVRLKIHGFMNFAELELLSVVPSLPDGWQGGPVMFCPFHSTVSMTLLPGPLREPLTLMPVSIARAGRFRPDIIQLPFVKKGSAILNTSHWNEEGNYLFWEEKRRCQNLLAKFADKKQQ